MIHCWRKKISKPDHPQRRSVEEVRNVAINHHQKTNLFKNQVFIGAVFSICIQHLIQIS